MCSLRIQVGCCCSHTHTHTHTHVCYLAQPGALFSDKTFILHIHACSRRFLVIPQPKKVSGFSDVGPIDHHYYCSLLIPMEMRPAAAVLGDWGWGQGPPPPGFASEYQMRLTAAHCSARWAQPEGHGGTWTRGLTARPAHLRSQRTGAQGARAFAGWRGFNWTGV